MRLWFVRVDFEEKADGIVGCPSKLTMNEK